MPSFHDYCKNLVMELFALHWGSIAGVEKGAVHSVCICLLGDWGFGIWHLGSCIRIPPLFGFLGFHVHTHVPHGIELFLFLRRVTFQEGWKVAS